MEFLSFFTTSFNYLKNFVHFALRKFGYKITKIDEYNNETIKIKPDYINKSEKCIEELNNGSKFYWSEYQTPGYEKYFEIRGATRTYFWNDSKQYLWIKRNSGDESV